jgi:hypothetical protein
MPRLVTFGCSYTFGHGLVDCFMPPTNPGLHPSSYAWPNLLAKKLGYECLNLSNPGSGNFEILMRILQTSFEKDDLVITQFSFFNRYEFYRMTDKIKQGERIPFDSEIFKEILSESSDRYLGAYKNYWDNWLAIKLVELFLDSKQIKNCFYISDVNDSAPEPSILEMKNFIRGIKTYRLDKGLDNSHPGPKSHETQADILYNSIIKKNI